MTKIWLKYLNKEANSKTESVILRSVRKKIQLIKDNYHYGEPIAKKLIPDEYKKRYGISNLFWVELPNYWRMLYSLVEGETKIEIVAFVLDIMDHKRYDKVFGYRKK